MPTLITSPKRIEAAGNRPKVIEEFVGRVNSAESRLSVARMKSPAGWVEPGQTPEFDEFTVVIAGMIRVTHKGGVIDAIRDFYETYLQGSWTSIIDILLVAFVIYWLFILIRGTRAVRIVIVTSSRVRSIRMSLTAANGGWRLSFWSISLRIWWSSTRKLPYAALGAYQRDFQSSVIPVRNPVGLTF